MTTGARARRSGERSGLDPDLAARRAAAAAALFGCHHPGKHHYMTEVDALAGRAPARYPTEPDVPAVVRRCCGGGWIWTRTGSGAT